MKLTERLLKLARRPLLPARTVRVRLTLLYGGLFIICGAGLLTVTYLLVTHASSEVISVTRSPNGNTVTVRGTSGSGGATLALPLTGSNVPYAGPGVPNAGSDVPYGIHVHIRATPAEGSGETAGAGGSAQSTGGGSAQSTGGAAPILPGIIAAAPTKAQARSRLPKQVRAQVDQLQRFATEQHATELHRLLVQSGIALALTTAAALALGWLVAGRALAPVRTMTAATRRISERNLHERLSLVGPKDELKELADTIDGLLGRLEAAFEAQRRFVANASHELRTPLAMMRTSLDVAHAKPGARTTEAEALDAKLREGLDQAERLLESFLVLARAERGVLPELGAVSLPQLLTDALQTQREQIVAARIDVRRRLESAAVPGSPTLLSRMVENLIDNAIRHNEHGGWISVRSSLHGTIAELVVENGGAKLDEDEVRQLAQPFRRLGAERTGTGHGLGLSIVSAIAQAHGGSLHLAARSDGGLRATVRLPDARLLLSAVTTRSEQTGVAEPEHASDAESRRAGTAESGQQGTAE